MSRSECHVIINGMGCLYVPLGGIFLGVFLYYLMRLVEWIVWDESWWVMAGRTVALYIGFCISVALLDYRSEWRTLKALAKSACPCCGAFYGMKRARYIQKTTNAEYRKRAKEFDGHLDFALYWIVNCYSCRINSYYYFLDRQLQDHCRGRDSDKSQKNRKPIKLDPQIERWLKSSQAEYEEKYGKPAS
jgi:hypothetical protein